MMTLFANLWTGKRGRLHLNSSKKLFLMFLCKKLKEHWKRPHSYSHIAFAFNVLRFVLWKRIRSSIRDAAINKSVLLTFFRSYCIGLKSHSILNFLWFHTFSLALKIIALKCFNSDDEDWTFWSEKIWISHMKFNF